jgi:protein-disulfide isomerase
MAPYRRLGLVLFALVAAVGLHAASAATAPASSPLLAEEVALGNPKAKVTVVEYASAACPHCARFNNDVFPAFKKKYVDTGKVRYVFRELLTDPVPFAGTAFMMARCAGESKYFDVLNDVFQQQTAIYQSGDLSGGLLKIGMKYGMDKDRLNACMDEKAVDALNARVEKANKDGVDSTPTFVIAGNKSVGEKSLEDLSAAIDPLLAK